MEWLKSYCENKGSDKLDSMSLTYTDVTCDKFYNDINKCLFPFKHLFAKKYLLILFI